MKKENAKKFFWMCFTLVLSVLTVWALLKQSESMSVETLINKIEDANKAWIAIAMLSALSYIIFEGVALCSILKGIGCKTHFLSGLLYSTSDVYFSAVTPSATGGQPASAYFMVKDGIGAGVTSAALILNLMMYNAAIIFLGIVAIIVNPKVLLSFHTTAKIFIILGFVGLTLLSLVFLAILKGGDRVFSGIRRIMNYLHDKKLIHHFDRRIKKLDKIEEDYANCVGLIANKKAIMAKAFLGNVLQRAGQIMVPAFAFIAMGGDKSMTGLMFSKQCLITIGYNYVPIPGALGIADYLMIDGFSSIMSKSAAFELDMISRGMTFYICVTVSGIITLIGYIKGKIV